MKYYLFIDESGDHGLTTLNPDFPVFLLCGVIVGAEEYNGVIVSFNAIKKRALEKQGGDISQQGYQKV